MNPNYKLAEAIRSLVDEGLTQRQVAVKLGLTQSGVSSACRAHGITWRNKRRDQSGASNRNFKDGLSKSTIERVTRTTLLKDKRDLTRCERCGYVDCTKQELPRHHKDRDRSNNHPSNLVVLCWGCHNQEHMLEKVRDALGRFVT